jgi:Tol biopolymer transport system component/DNA-binding winged helix-turn-helix (wHTH) protein
MHNPRGNKIYEFEGFRLDAAQLLLYRENNEVSVPPKAIETLLALLERRGEVVGKNDLMEMIWADTIVEESNLSQYLHLLRKTLGKRCDGKEFIETLKRRGYRFSGDVVVSESSAGFPPLRRTSTNESKNDEVINPNRRTRSVERRGNVLALADWSESSLVSENEATPARSITPSTATRNAVLVIAALTIGTAILFSVYRLSGDASPPERTAASVPFAQMNISRLTTSGKTTHAAISRDGKYVAHVTVDANGDSLWVRNVASPTSVRVAGPAATEYGSVTFAPDGDSVYYVTLDRDKGETALYRIGVLGGPSVMAAYDVGPVGFSPDGAQIAFVRNYGEASRLIVANADGTNERMLAERRQPEYFEATWNAPAWSPYGQTIAVQVRLSDERGPYETIIGVGADDGYQRPITTARWKYTGQPVWVANGEGLFVTATESSGEPMQVWHVALASGDATRITNDLNNYRDLSLTADSSRIAAVQENTISNFWVAPDGDRARAKQIASETGRIAEMAWTPDGRIVYRSNAGGNADIWVMDPDGSNAKQLTTGTHASRGLAVSPDGRFLFFASDRAGRFNLWRCDADGGDLMQLTTGDDDLYPNVTPDGAWVVYQRDTREPRLWKISVAGGEPIQVTDTRAMNPVVSPDGEMIAYRYLDSDVEKSRWRIGVVPSEGGSPLFRFDLPPTVAPFQRFVRWSPDGKAIAFPNSPGALADIWLQPLNGSPAWQLTDFRAEQVIAFDWSRDGSSLAIVRGVESSDVVLINNSGLK